MIVSVSLPSLAVAEVLLLLLLLALLLDLSVPSELTLALAEEFLATAIQSSASSPESSGKRGSGRGEANIRIMAAGALLR